MFLISLLTLFEILIFEKLFHAEKQTTVIQFRQQLKLGSF